MRIAIVGSRAIHINALAYIQLSIRNQFLDMPDHPTLISGGAIGIDSLAEGMARGMNHPVLIFKPEWDRHGKAAGFKRNQKIVDACDSLIAFSFGSAGTEDTIARIKASGKPYFIYNFSPLTGNHTGTERMPALGTEVLNA